MSALGRAALVLTLTLGLALPADWAPVCAVPTNRKSRWDGLFLSEDNFTAFGWSSGVTASSRADLNCARLSASIDALAADSCGVLSRELGKKLAAAEILGAACGVCGVCISDGTAGDPAGGAAGGDSGEIFGRCVGESWFAALDAAELDAAGFDAAAGA